MKPNEVLDFISQYGGYDGEHHKQWVIDQIVRMLTIDYESYKKWVKEYSNGEDGTNTYEWHEGIAP